MSRRNGWVVVLGVALGLGGCSCGSSDGGIDDGGRSDTGGDDGAMPGDDATAGADATAPDGSGGPGPDPDQRAELWYSVDDLLVHIALDEDDGSVAAVHASELTVELELGQNAITMLDDGSLLGARLGQADSQSHFYFIADPPRDGGDVTPEMLGVMPDGIMIEGLYTDCEGRLYAMDTGADDTSSEGNRLLYFTGDPLAGDFSFDVVSDLDTAVVADIDDMSPGIDGNEVTDNPGLAIDTGDIYDFNYETGTGTMVATGGTFGMHALGAPLFTDASARLYVLSDDAELFEVDPETFTLSDALGTGPAPDEGTRGWSGLAGPLTECDSGFTLI